MYMYQTINEITPQTPPTVRHLAIRESRRVGEHHQHALMRNGALLLSTETSGELPIFSRAPTKFTFFTFCSEPMPRLEINTVGNFRQ